MNTDTNIDLSNVPKHIAIIMDGNGRWAKQQGHDRLFGHSSGVDSVREVVSACKKIGIQYLTLYAFSVENWNRPKEEVDGLMELMVHTIVGELPELMEGEIRINCIGDINGLPENARIQMIHAMETTKNNKGLNLVLALNYSSRWEITNAVKEIAKEISLGKISTKDISEELISKHLTTSGLPDPDLVIRTSGEYRLSNFLLWQSSYSEFYFTEVLWPDFKENELYKAVAAYQCRERRYGKISDQVKKA